MINRDNLIEFWGMSLDDGQLSFALLCLLFTTGLFVAAFRQGKKDVGFFWFLVGLIPLIFCLLPVTFGVLKNNALATVDAHLSSGQEPKLEGIYYMSFTDDEGYFRRCKDLRFNDPEFAMLPTGDIEDCFDKTKTLALKRKREIADATQTLFGSDFEARVSKLKEGLVLVKDKSLAKQFFNVMDSVEQAGKHNDYGRVHALSDFEELEREVHAKRKEQVLDAQANALLEGDEE